VVASYATGYLVPEEIPAAVQRAEEESPLATSPPPEAPPEEPAGAEINVDELTRKVYQEIKRRLTGEWERMRRRF
jgi:hypothetical protein